MGQGFAYLADQSSTVGADAAKHTSGNQPKLSAFILTYPV